MAVAWDGVVVTMMDQWLVQTARSRATGANVHAVAGLCQQLLIAAHFADDGDAEAKRHAEGIRRSLHTLVKTGRLPRETSRHDPAAKTRAD